MRPAGHVCPGKPPVVSGILWAAVMPRGIVDMMRRRRRWAKLATAPDGVDGAGPGVRVNQNCGRGGGN
jgi:hypothetical protein